MHQCDMIMDFQFGSTGKGLLAGYMAKRGSYDTVVCSFATNAGHTYVDESRGIKMMTQQLPTGISSPTVKHVLIGPGSLIHVPTLLAEINRYGHMLVGKRILIHPHAAIVLEQHMEQEIKEGMSKIGSTTKGVGAAMIDRIRRHPDSFNQNVAKWFLEIAEYVCTADEYRYVLEHAGSILVEGAQGYSLSMYHGFYPFVTSRDVTPWQIAADCGLPFKWAPYIKIFGTIRTYPIRVNNRDGYSGDCYEDQSEIEWRDIGVNPELTTVTKLPRRVFSFSMEQIQHAVWHCGQYYETQIFLNFANYMRPEDVKALVSSIEIPRDFVWNPPKISFIGYGADDKDVMTRSMFNLENMV